MLPRLAHPPPAPLDAARGCNACPAVIAIGNDLSLDGAFSLQAHNFGSNCRTLLLRSFEGAFYVGALPSIFARNEAILHERSESYRIAVLVFANCLIIELLELLAAVDRHGSVDTAAMSCDGSAVASDSDGSLLSDRQQRSAGCSAKGTSVAAGAVVADGRDGSVASPDGVPLVRRYLENADRVHMGVVGAQSSLVCALLVGFLYTKHWRSHAISLVSNYALLYSCVLFRQQRLR